MRTENEAAIRVIVELQAKPGKRAELKHLIETPSAAASCCCKYFLTATRLFRQQEITVDIRQSEGGEMADNFLSGVTFVEGTNDGIQCHPGSAHSHNAIAIGLQWGRTIFRSEGFEIVPLPHQAPNANAFAERWVRSVRQECLDQLLIWNEAHLNRVLSEYVNYYNARRPHQGLRQDSPDGLEPVSLEGEIHRRNVLGGVIHDYYRQAA